MAKDKQFVTEITPQSEDFSRWYIDVIKKADLMDYSPVRGCIVFKPEGYEIWEHIQEEMNRRLKATGHRNAYFPVFIPESFFQKEKDHIEGFNPELPWVTEAGGDVLEERLAVRPTSETMFGHMYSKWIQSYRDLPVLINQWANVVRWEKRTLPFIRTTEFLWQEGHTAHENETEAREETMRMLENYRDFVESFLAIPVVTGQKTPSERFAGAVDTYSIEAMMKDGRAVQAATSHYLGTKFAEAFEIQYLSRENSLEYVHTTSWGSTTRLIGSLIMVHGDDRGLALPPKVAPTQVIMIPIGPPKTREAVIGRTDELFKQLKDAGVRVRVDDRADLTPGWKFNEYEMRGVPVRLELGPRDMENGVCVLVSRITGEKKVIQQDNLVEEVQAMLEQVHNEMFERALKFREDHFYSVDSLEEMKASMEEKRGFALAGWCGTEECEDKVKEETGAGSRNIPFNPAEQKTACICCGKPAKHTVVFAKAY
ncbi:MULTISPECIES: proline--tRNA ligase [unclassified Paenibacillus]|uniref:proline--tRNA ligase n=1 Tax=unclassified Paenibacillus TaxID=185978 RepID=UPI0024076BD1|nr:MULTISPECIES: proline--tRNA ligase [unclassified Paenibacillus]MDF9841345.1 prolyl-tRNA synthetase [Paenibacillus sp. PastF-2]MDF9847936.1 prolyl-tRNA synthetase [Paenibacillus sp. PastM-2]MDF9854504.1 prolyl-tRNA synthetase [Paenibacillus sp. PastF-1]MDH6479887.1 prolyl-tRNA synthetase [Paenibacillus sp. PastH-2]MDH6507211.1 prolyl-tRNA synthetase [Paenibacillus sp. PastM-3]